MELIAGRMEKPPCNHWHLISIYETTCFPFLTFDVKLRLENQAFMDKSISLSFDDITLADYETLKIVYPDLILFNRGHAREIIDFIKQVNSETEPSMLVIHCRAGISRSGAVALFAAVKLGIEFSDPYIRPNQWMLKILNEEYNYEDNGKDIN